jgi:hypothetical protein
MRSLPLLAAAIALCALSACGKPASFGLGDEGIGRTYYDYVNEAESCEARAPVGSIDISCSFSDERRQVLVDDLRSLEGMSFTARPATEKLKRALGIDRLSGHTLFSWLERRARYLLAGSFDARRARGTNQLALNYGAYRFYLAQSLELPTPRANIPGHGLLTIGGADVGLVRLSDGFFAVDPASAARYPHWARLSRLSTLIHEARHSDGFQHQECPSGHPNAGRTLCDGEEGPYAIEAYFLEAFADSCADCSQSEKLYLRIYSDLTLENNVLR